MGWGQIAGLAPTPIDYAYLSTSSLNVSTGQGADTVNVQATGVPMAVLNYGGQDTVNVGDQGSLGNITANLAVFSISGKIQLNVDDWADSTVQTAYLTASGYYPEITGLAPASIFYANLSGLSITTGTAADTVDVYSTYYPTTLSGYGRDTVNVGFDGSLSGITGALSVNNATSHTALNIDDSDDPVSRSPTISFIAISGLAPGTISYEEYGLSALTIWGGDGNNTFTVDSTPTSWSDLTTALNTGHGQDDVVTVQPVLGALDVNGQGARNTLVGPNTANIWYITGANAGSLGNVSFTGIDNLTGGTGNDTFQFGVWGSVDGVVDGGSGANTLDYSGLDGLTVTVNLANATASRTGGFANFQSLVGTSSSGNTLIGPNATNVWSITGDNAGTVGSFSFSEFGSPTGGTGVDEFVFSAGAALSGKIDGGSPGGNDWLDYAAYTMTAVTVNLASDSATAVDGGVAGGIANIRNVRGGQHSDTLTGNPLGNILIGGAGNDTINGGSGRSVLIGDTGTDTIKGGSADDIVIGGYTTYDGSSDAHDQALGAILAEWQSADPYTTRITKIKAGVGPMHAKFVLGTTVFSDGKANTLNGGEMDWFFKGTKDTITDLQSGEQVN
jgi:hypothetical protein